MVRLGLGFGVGIHTLVRVGGEVAVWVRSEGVSRVQMAGCLEWW